MTRGKTRERFTLVGLTTAVAVLMTSSLAGATGDSVHACVERASGSIRIVDSGDSCRKNETALDWSKTGNAYTAGSGLALSADNEFSVTGAPWSGITGVPTELADGDDDGTARVEELRSELAPEITNLGTGLHDVNQQQEALQAGLGVNDGTANEQTDLVSFFQIKDLVGNIFGLYIADGTVTADDLATDSVGHEELTDDAVTSGSILDQTIQSADLAHGSVTTDHQAANASSGTVGPSILSDGSPATAASTAMNIPANGSATNHSVLIVGQAVFHCTNCDPNTTVTYQVVRDDGTTETVVSPTFSLAPGDASDIVLPVSVLDFTGAGAYAYELKVTASSLGAGTAVVDSDRLSAIDLGRTG